jgi:hypothetical protein
MILFKKGSEDWVGFISQEENRKQFQFKGVQFSV